MTSETARRRRGRLLALCAGLAVAAAALAGCTTTDNVQEFATTALGTGAFSRPVINITTDDHVDITLGNTTDQVRGFSIDEYGIHEVVKPGGHAAVRFVAKHAGTFR